MGRTDRPRIRLALAVVALGCVVRPGPARALDGPAIDLSRDDRETRARVLERMAAHKVPGLGIALIDGYRVAWARGYGVVRAGGAEPVTAATRFQAASISKPVAALAALRLVQAGRLDLDEPIDGKLASWKVPENEFTRARAPTLRHLLDHSGGFSVHGFVGYGPGERLPTLAQILDGTSPARSRPVRVEFVPGSRFQYSGGGYCVLQQWIVDVARRPFPEALRGLVLDPLGMAESSCGPPTADAPFAVGHAFGIAIPGGRRAHPELAAAGLVTTPADLARFAVALQRAKRGDPGAILSPPLIAEMLRRQVGDEGLGLAISGTGRGAAFAHGGTNVGYECRLIGFAETGQGAVLMTNAIGGHALIAELIESLRAGYRWPG